VLLDLTDRSMIMVKGRVVYDGPSAELKSQPEILQKHIGL
jgi:branched-chain amino acid transport system ATP-binding protein